VLALEREPARIAARAFDGGDAYVRGTALEYLETVLPPALFAALVPRLFGAAAPAPCGRAAEEVRAQLLDAGATMTMSAPEVRRQLGMGEEDAE
jgi:hypothetical protein